MNIKIHFIFILITMMGLSLSSTASAWIDHWPTLKTPVGVKKYWIAQNIQHNGVNMQIAQIKGSTPAEQTLQFYRRLWQNSKAQSSFFAINDQLVLSTLVRQWNGDFQLTLELQADSNKTQGILSSLKLGQTKPHPAALLDLQLPHGTAILSDTLASELNTISRTLVGEHKMSFDHAQFHFESRLQANGWSLIPGATPSLSVSRNEVLLRFQKQADELTLTLFRDEKTKIVAVYIRRG